MKEEIFERLKPLIVRADYNKSISISEIDYDSDFEKDLGLNSIDKIELLMFCEKEFNIIIDYYDESKNTNTVNDLINTIIAK